MKPLFKIPLREANHCKEMYQMQLHPLQKKQGQSDINYIFKLSLPLYFQKVPFSPAPFLCFELYINRTGQQVAEH